MKKKVGLLNDEIIRFFEDAGYNNVEIVGNRLLFTTGEDVVNWSIQEAINFIDDVCKNGCSWEICSNECFESCMGGDE